MRNDFPYSILSAAHLARLAYHRLQALFTIPIPFCPWCRVGAHVSVSSLPPPERQDLPAAAENYFVSYLEWQRWSSAVTLREEDWIGRGLTHPDREIRLILFNLKFRFSRLLPYFSEEKGEVKNSPDFFALDYSNGRCQGGSVADVTTYNFVVDKTKRIQSYLDVLRGTYPSAAWRADPERPPAPVYIPTGRYFICTWPTYAAPGPAPAGVLLYALHDTRGQEIESYVYVLSPALRRRFREVFEEALRRLKSAPGKVMETAQWVYARAIEVRDWIRANAGLVVAVVLAAVILVLVMVVIDWAVVVALAVWLIRLAFLPLLRAAAPLMVP